MYRKIRHIHCIGIGGSGMSGIAEVLLNLGYKVSGSDLHSTDVTQRLSHLGGTVHIGHDPKNIEGADVVVISSAVTSRNVEVQAAKKSLIPVIPRAEMLAELMRLKYGVAIAGAHGKTTTTSMVAMVLANGGMDPTVVIGGKLNILGSNAKLGQGEFLVAEADESDGSFLKLSPTIAVVTTIDEEHLDYYKDISEIKKAFLQFINKIPFYGLAVLSLDDQHIQSLIPKVEKRYITYGLTTQADFAARDIDLKGMKSSFDVLYRHRALGRFEVSVPGIHNIYNALAAIAVGMELEVSLDTIKRTLSEFSGVQRRFQIKGEIEGIIVVDDYGHHPTEIKATLSAAKRGWDRRTLVVFQPHRYTRTRDLLGQFGTAFYYADSLILTEIYPAGEEPIPDINGLRLYEVVKNHGHRDVVFIPEKGKILEHLLGVVQEGDLVITLGAGDIWKIGDELIKKLEKRHK